MRFEDMDDDEFARMIGRLRTFGTDTQRVEVKSCGAGLTKDIAKTVSAFANGTGGMIVLGLDERRGFAPVEGFDAARMQDALSQCCTERMSPPVTPIIDIRLFEGAPVVAACIPELWPRDKPCFVAASGRYGGSYLRTGDGDRRLSTYEVDRLMDEHVQPRYDDALVEGATMDDLDRALVQGLLARERMTHARAFAQLDDAAALRRLHVAREDEAGVMRPTKAGLLALGSYPQEFFPRLNVTFSCYPGTEKGEVTSDGLRFVDAVTCVGPIPAMVADAVAAVRRNIRCGARVEGALRRDVEEYPVVAVREAIVNALMHRDYSPAACGSPVYVNLFADRLEVINLGGLYGSVTVGGLASGVMGSARNQHLASILESTPLDGVGFVAENRGSGYVTMCQAMREEGLPDPDPNDSLSSFTLTLWGRPRRPDPSDARLAAGGCEGARRRPCVTRQVIAIENPQGDLVPMLLDVIVEYGDASTKELMERTGRSRPTVLKALRSLIDEGVVVPTEGRTSPRQRYRLASGYY